MNDFLSRREELSHYLYIIRRMKAKLVHKYTFAVQWPQSALWARTDRRDLRVSHRIPKNVWTVKGLWSVEPPQSESNALKDKEDRLFNHPKKLLEIWPSLSEKESTNKFFDSQYNRMRTHIGGKARYLEQVLQLSKEFNPLFHLKKLNFDEDGVIEKDIVLKAVAFGFYTEGSIVLRCLNPTKLGDSYLQEVRYCLNEDFALTPCNDEAWREFNCPWMVALPKRETCRRFKRPSGRSDPLLNGGLEQCLNRPKSSCERQLPWFI